MLVLLDGDGEPLPRRVPVDHEFVAVNPRSAWTCRAGDAGEVLAAGCGVDLIDTIGIILGSNPEIRGGRLYDTFKRARKLLDGFNPASRLIAIRHRNRRSLRRQTLHRQVASRTAHNDGNHRYQL